MTHIYLTVGDLQRILSGIHPETWVCLKDGPAVSITKELGANEPFILIEGPETCSMHGKLNDANCEVCRMVKAECSALSAGEDNGG